MFILVILGRMNIGIYVHERWWVTMDSWRCEGHYSLEARGNGGLCLHNMRMRCNKSAGRMVNSAASRCVYARRQVFVWDTRIPAAEPLADPPRTTVTSPNMVHMQAWSSSCGFCQWQPSILLPPSPPPFSPSLSLSTSCNHDYKGKLICSKRTKCTPWGLSVAFPPPMRDSRSSFHCHPTTLPRSIACPRSLTSSTLPAFTKGLIQDRCFVLVCSTTWQQEQWGGGGGSKTVYENFAPGVWSAGVITAVSSTAFFLDASRAISQLREVINCHHLPSNTQAATQTGTPGPRLELRATYSPAGITQTTA